MCRTLYFTTCVNSLSKRKRKNMVTGNSPGCFSIIDRESTQGAGFPILQLKKLQPRAPKCPVRGHTENEQQAQKEKLSLQEPASVLPPLTSQPGAPRGCSNTRTPYLAWPSPPAASPPPQSQTRQRESGEGLTSPRVRVGGRVNPGAPSSGASLPRVPWAAASSLWAQRRGGGQTPGLPSPTPTLQVP